MLNGTALLSLALVVKGTMRRVSVAMKGFPRTTTITKRNYLPTYPYARDEVRTNPNYNNNNNSTVTPNNNNKNN